MLYCICQCKVRRISTLLIGAVCNIFLSNALAIADEVWQTEEYKVIYLKDQGKTAIWSYNNDTGHIFIDGLGGVTTNRGSYNGYWVQPESSRRCDTYREGPDGEPTYHWGRFEITFLDPDFPSRWQAKFGVCDGLLRIQLNGTPVTALDR